MAFQSVSSPEQPDTEAPISTISALLDSLLSLGSRAGSDSPPDEDKPAEPPSALDGRSSTEMISGEDDSEMALPGWLFLCFWSLALVDCPNCQAGMEGVPLVMVGGAGNCRLNIVRKK